MQIFYHPEAEAGKHLEFDDQESGHMIRVLRVRSGDKVLVTDGKGSLCEAIVEVNRSGVKAEVLSCEVKREKDYPVEIAIAPTKSLDRVEWFIEKATEIGIGRITPYVSYYSERNAVRADRLEKVAISAMKQSLKFRLPRIAEMTDFKSWMANCDADMKFIAHCSKNVERIPLKHVLKPGASVAIAIGPEGDFSEDEIQLAIEYGFVSVSLGDSRLRTETAALVALHTFELINQV